MNALIARRDAMVHFEMDWSYSDVPEYSRRRADQLRFIEVLRTAPLIVMADPDGARPSLEIEAPSLEADAELTALRRFVENILTIQKWAASSFQLPIAFRGPTLRQ